ncbi:MAG: cell division ATP-binding protein FtsE [Flavobacteriaceae bacterium]
MSETPVLLLENAQIKQDKSVILDRIHLTMSAGDYFFLIGKTGSGKSSFLKALYGDVPFSQGTAQLKSFNLRTLSERQLSALRRSIGIVFQDFKLLNDRNVFENLDFVLKATGWKQSSARKNQIESVLERVSMEHKLNSFPHRLSGGEQQRVAIARALLNDPDLIIADEPTGNLDPETSHEVMQLFEEINRNGKSLLVATHNHQLIAHFGHPVVECAQQTLTLQ